MSRHDRFFPAREIERVTWRDYALALGFALALVGLCALSI
jgi:hypothetical protein